MTTGRGIRWGRVLPGGLFIELALFAIAVPMTIYSPDALYYLVPFLVLVSAFVFGWWAARPLESRFVLHGVLVAVVASVIYIALTTASGVAGELPLLYHLSHGLRIIGGAAGGAFAARRAGAPRSVAGAA
jgi:putative membrane protein (TIGR04086 family)